MTSKERVLSAINHNEPDRVPLNYCGGNIIIEKKLREFFNVQKDSKDGLLNALNVDFRGVDVEYTGKKLHDEIPGIRVEPLWGIKTKWIENNAGGYWDFCDFPLKNVDLEVVKNWPMPNPDDFDYSTLPEKCRKYENYCVTYGHPGMGDIINSTGMLMGMEKVLIGLATQDNACIEFIKRKAKTQLCIMERVLDVAKGAIDLIWLGEDLGTQQGPLISMDMFKKYIRPLHQGFVDLATSYDIPVMIHSCGSSSWAFEEFIQMGIKVVDTLQPEAKNMSPEFLKQKFGNRLCFNGCISTAGPLAYGTMDEAVEDVRQKLDILKPGGGYILAPTHMLQDSTPVENVKAVYEFAYKYGQY